jgi:hypothetical protein
MVSHPFHKEREMDGAQSIYGYMKRLVEVQ